MLGDAVEQPRVASEPALVSESVGNVGNQNVSRVRKQRRKADARKSGDRAIGTHTTSKTVEICWAQFPPAAVVATSTRAAASLGDRWGSLRRGGGHRRLPPRKGTGHGSGATPPAPPERRWRAKRGQLASQPRRERTTERSEVVRASGNEVFALLDKTGTRQCPVVVAALHCAARLPR